MDLTWAVIAQTLLAGLAGMLGVYVIEEVLRVLRRKGLCPQRWNTPRLSLLPRTRGGEPAAGERAL